MFARGIPEFRLFDMFGVPVYMNVSFAVIAAMFVMDMGGDILFGLSFAAVLALSVLLHEFGHIGAARGFGVRARRITLSLLGGCASLDEIPRAPGAEFATAIAGPAVSFALSGISYLLLRFTAPPPFFAYLLFYGMWLNLVLGCFNLLPGFPMDGGRVFRSLMARFVSRERATWWAMAVGRVTAAGIALWGVYDMAATGSIPFIRFLIVLMIWQEGRREYEMVRYWG